MLGKLMAGEAVSCDASFITQITGVRLLVGVGATMGDEMVTLGESFITLITGEWLLAGVGQ